MQKEVSKPFNGKLCGSWRPADYNSPHIQTCQQFLIKDLTISDSHHGLNSLEGHRQIRFMSAHQGANDGVRIIFEKLRCPTHFETNHSVQYEPNGTAFTK